MKKFFAICLSFMLVISLFTVTRAFAGGTPQYRLGDVDNDGAIAAADARFALRASVGLEKYAAGSFEFLAADVDRDGKLTAADARLILRASVGLEDLVKAEDVAGYPKKDGEKTLLAFFVNGRRADFDVYTYAKAPKDVYAPPCPICWSYLDIDAVSISTSVEGVNVKGAFAVRINGFVVTNHTGIGSTTVGNNTYTDLVPEYYHNDYHCSLLLFSKTVNAKVIFSPNGSAVYMNTGAVDKKASQCNDFDLSVDGTLRYSGNAQKGTDAEEPTTEKKPADTPVKTITCFTCHGTGRAICTMCGGSGRTWGSRTEYQRDPFSGIMMPRQVATQVSCMSCGGLGGRTCSTCGGSGRKA